MSEMEWREEEIDSLLRRSLSGPIPGLPAGFEERVARNVMRSSEPLKRSGRVLLASYGVLSAAVSVVVMRGQGLSWEGVFVTTLGSFALLAVGRFAVRWSSDH